MRPVVYIETTVISYLTARPSRDVLVAGHQAVTVEWWEKDLPKFDAFVSSVVLDEVSAGDPEAVAKRLAAIKEMSLLELTPEVKTLAMKYYGAIPFPEAARADAVHLALAAWHSVDYLLTWNCRHIANGQVRRQIGILNDSLGIPTPVICTPEELLEYSDDQGPTS